MEKLLEFYQQLSCNNNREWFEAHRSQWEALRQEALNFAATMINCIARYDSNAARFTPQECTYRINRDIRFSPDKTPYKTHFGVFINPPYGKKALTCGYYFHLEPGACGFYAGTYGLPSNILAAIRKSIYDNIEEYVEIVETPSFRTHLPNLGDDFLKTAPKGYDRNWKYIDYLRPRTYCAYNTQMQSIFLNKNVETLIEPYIREAKKFNDFINYTIEEFDVFRPTPERRK